MSLAMRKFFVPSPLRRQAQDLYVAIVTQARQPFIYSGYHVPDTLDGRFDAIVLHVFLVINRLQNEGDARLQLLCRLLNESFIADMDRSIREMGVGDTGVGKRIKKMGSALLGRLKVYSESADDKTRLVDALARNLYREAPGAPENAARLAEYVQATRQALAQQDAHAIARGEIQFVS